QMSISSLRFPVNGHSTAAPANFAALAAEPDLKALADTIRKAHQVVTCAGISIVRATELMLEKALVAGEALLAAKRAVKQAFGNGHWLPWLKEECDLSEREAQRYMLIARHRAILEANTTCVSDLTMTGALQLLKKLQNPTADRPRSN